MVEDEVIRQISQPDCAVDAGIGNTESYHSAVVRLLGYINQAHKDYYGLSILQLADDIVAAKNSLAGATLTYDFVTSTGAAALANVDSNGELWPLHPKHSCGRLDGS